MPPSPGGPGPSPRAAPLPNLLRPQYAFIKRISDTAFEDEAFAKVQLEGCMDVADVAARACEKFPRWGVDAGQVYLFLAAAGGKVEPPLATLKAAAADPTARLSENWLLTRAGIAPGCWLLARVPPPPAAAAAGYIFIKRISDTAYEDEAFAAIELRPADTVALLVGRACEKFEWGAPTKVHLHLAAAGGKVEPSLAALKAAAANPAERLGVGLPLDDAGIVPGCWLLARGGRGGREFGERHVKKSLGASAKGRACAQGEPWRGAGCGR